VSVRTSIVVGLRHKSTVVLLGLIGALLVVVAANRPWFTVASDAVGAVASGGGAVTGDRLVPGMSALGFVLGAAAVAVTLARRVGRVVAGAASVLGSLVLLGFLAMAHLDQEGTLRRTGLLEAGAPVPAATVIWPIVASLGALLALAGGLATLAFGAGWSAPRGRAANAVPEAVESDWDKLSRGDDPTA
jgi:tryptophan-associated transmembrane protein